MSQGRLPSLFLLSTDPISGTWFPPRARDQANTSRKWHWDGSRIHWLPDEPEGAGMKIEFMSRLLGQIDRLRKNGESSFLKLSGTSKTGITWSLPAVGACPQLDETCRNCYALDGFYRTNVAAQVGRVMRLEYLRKLISVHQLDKWVGWASETIGRLRPVEEIPQGTPLNPSLKAILPEPRQKISYFRWHDSGDLFHIEYARAVFNVCRNTPSVLHWLPTRMGSLLATLVRSGEMLPPNLAVQVSCHRGGVLEKNQHAAIEEIRRLQPDARVGVTYAHMGTKSRTVKLPEVHAKFGDTASLCPATIALEREKRVCSGCRRCWAFAAIDEPIVYAVHLGN